MINMIKNTYRTNVSSVLTYTLIVIVSLLHITLFTHGYRTTADDIYYDSVVRDGFINTIKIINNFAIVQGRITHYFAGLGIFAAGYSDIYSVRLAYAFAHFGALLLFGIYLSKVLKINFAAIFFVIALFITPLDYFHLPPNTYPLHVALPVLILIGSRLYDFKNHNKKNNQLISPIIAFIGVMFSEGAFTFFVALILTEIIIKFAQIDKTKNHIYIFISKIWREYYLSFYVIILFLIIYILFRVKNPSAYDGNTISNTLNFYLFFKTLIGHVYGGTAFSSFARYYHEIFLSFKNSTSNEKLLLLSIFLISYYIIKNLFQKFYVDYKDKLSPPLLCTLFFIGISGAVIITTPLALVDKYQKWCGSIHSCIFHDSRMSYHFTALIILVSLISIIKFFNIKRQYLAIKFMAVIFAFASSFTYINNLRISEDMKKYTEGWNRAKGIACFNLSGQKFKYPPGTLSLIIDPDNRIVTRAGQLDREEYWIKYIKDIETKNNISCSDYAYVLQDFETSKPIDWNYKFSKDLISKSKSTFFWFAEGLSGKEVWGQWSDAHISKSVKFHFKKELPKNFDLILDIHAFGPNAGKEMKIRVFDNDIYHQIPMHAGETVIPVRGVENSRTIEITPPIPISPNELGISNDSRKIAIGFRSMKIIEK
jgi:hypothetical protein